MSLWVWVGVCSPKCKKKDHACSHWYLHVLLACVSNAVQTKSNRNICLFVICPVAVCSHTNPYLRTYSALSFGVRLQVDRRAWQEGRKPLALLLACH